MLPLTWQMSGSTSGPPLPSARWASTRFCPWVAVVRWTSALARCVHFKRCERERWEKARKKNDEQLWKMVKNGRILRRCQKKTSEYQNNWEHRPLRSSEKCMPERMPGTIVRTYIGIRQNNSEPMSEDISECMSENRLVYVSLIYQNMSGWMLEQFQHVQSVSKCRKSFQATRQIMVILRVMDVGITRR